MQQNTGKKVFGFKNKSILIGCGEFFLLWREFLSLAVNVLTSSPKISDLTKREVFKLNLSYNDEKVRSNCSLEGLSSVCDPLARELPKGVLK